MRTTPAKRRAALLAHTPNEEGGDTLDTLAAADALPAAVDALYTALRARALDEAQRVSVAVACAGLEDAQKAFKKARKAGQC